MPDYAQERKTAISKRAGFIFGVVNRRYAIQFYEPLVL